MKHEVVFEGHETVYYKKSVTMTDKEVWNLKQQLQRYSEEDQIAMSDFFSINDISHSDDIEYENFYCYVDDEDIMEETDV